MLGMSAKEKENTRKNSVEEFTQKYHLEHLTESDPELLERLTVVLSNSDSLNLVSALSGNQPDRAKIAYLDSLTKQNWIIINQLNRLNENMEKLINK